MHGYSLSCDDIHEQALFRLVAFLSRHTMFSADLSSLSIPFSIRNMLNRGVDEILTNWNSFPLRPKEIRLEETSPRHRDVVNNGKYLTLHETRISWRPNSTAGNVIEPLPIMGHHFRTSIRFVYQASFEKQASFGWITHVQCTRDSPVTFDHDYIKRSQSTGKSFIPLRLRQSSYDIAASRLNPKSRSSR
jgi:hypothetical protein